MKNTGVVRKVDELGRIVIPIELRRTLGISKEDKVEIYMEKDTVMVEKYNDNDNLSSTTSIVRFPDELGRIVIPVEIRRNLGIEEKSPLEIFVDGKKMIFKKYEPGCIFCGEIRDVLNYKGKKVCVSCKNDIIKL